MILESVIKNLTFPFILISAQSDAALKLDFNLASLVLPRGRLVLGARYGSLPYWQHASCQRISGYDPQRAHYLPPAGMAAVGGSGRLKPAETGG